MKCGDDQRWSKKEIRVRPLARLFFLQLRRTMKYVW